MKAHVEEVRKTLALAFPMIIGQLAGMAMAITDVAMVGKGVGTMAQASLTFALNFVHIPYIALWGLVSGTCILMAQAFGAQQHDRMPGLLRHGMVLAVGVALLAIAVMISFYHFVPVLPYMPYLGQDPQVVEMAETYLYLYSAAFITYLIGGCFRGACETQNKPWLPLRVLGCAIALNVFLNWVLINGHLGMPRLELAGAGLATLLSNACFVVAIATVVTRNKALSVPFRQLFRFEFRWQQMRQIANLGLPTSAQIAMEVGAFVVAALMIGSIGPSSLAAHQITLQVAALSFMVPLGMAFAVSIRVSQTAGANNMETARRIGVGSMVLVGLWMAFAACLIMLLRHDLAWAFSDDPVVVGIATQFMVVAAIFQVSDGVQCVGMGGLRGLRDVRLPTWLVLINYWIISLPLAWYLGFPGGFGGMGIWSALAVGLAITAVTMTARFLIISKRPPNPTLLAEPPAAAAH